ncbi:MAG TPA: leucyl/phenylalanyl-tRNA--protein transferase [Myxococcota bacterium]|nr:leucyl/phenylalanyl-tRNA--protein transferase [Myxococcota bacterium]
MADFFPDPNTADPYGLVAVSDTMTPELVVDAYRHGIFPWSTDPVRWYSPDPRAIFAYENIHLSKRLLRELRANRYRVTFDTRFAEVIRACAESHAHTGVWISELFISTYCELHERGHAHSVEVWQDDVLVGGLYGVQVNALYAGESMFHRVPNASKVAFAYLARHLQAIGVVLFDAQVVNDHTQRLGAVIVRRTDYLRRLKRALLLQTSFDGKKWALDVPPWER